MPKCSKPNQDPQLSFFLIISGVKFSINTAPGRIWHRWATSTLELQRCCLAHPPIQFNCRIQHTHTHWHMRGTLTVKQSESCIVVAQAATISLNQRARLTHLCITVSCQIEIIKSFDTNTFQYHESWYWQQAISEFDRIQSAKTIKKKQMYQIFNPRLHKYTHCYKCVSMCSVTFSTSTV